MKLFHFVRFTVGYVPFVTVALRSIIPATSTPRLSYRSFSFNDLCLTLCDILSVSTPTFSEMSSSTKHYLIGFVAVYIALAVSVFLPLYCLASSRPWDLPQNSFIYLEHFSFM